MTPKEKAKQLVNYFMDITPVDYSINDSAKEVNKKAIDDLRLCKQCALIAVDEILNVVPSVYLTDDEEVHNGHYQYWDEVKQEIKKL